MLRKNLSIFVKFWVYLLCLFPSAQVAVHGAGGLAAGSHLGVAGVAAANRERMMHFMFETLSVGFWLLVCGTQSASSKFSDLAVRDLTKYLMKILCEPSTLFPSPERGMLETL